MTNRLAKGIRKVRACRLDLDNVSGLFTIYEANGAQSCRRIQRRLEGVITCNNDGTALCIGPKTELSKSRPGLENIAPSGSRYRHYCILVNIAEKGEVAISFHEKVLVVTASKPCHLERGKRYLDSKSWELVR